MSRVLVTGAGGFIGSHVVESLIRDGRSVRALVRYNSAGTIGWLKALGSDILDHVEVVQGDIRDYESVSSAIKNCAQVLHLAALIGIPYSYLSPTSYVATNVNGTLNVLQASRVHEVSRVVHTSTSEVYGTAIFAPITEDHPLQAQSPYSASKISADQLAISYWRSFSTPTVVIRPFNTYGPRQSLRAVIPTIVSQLLSGERKIKLGSTTPTRDLTFVSDTAEGFVAALSAKDVEGQVIQLGTGFEISVGDLAHLIAEVMELSIEIVTDSARVRPEQSEVERLVSDPSRARELLDWEPLRSEKTGLIEGLRETIDWMRSIAPENPSQWQDYHV